MAIKIAQNLDGMWVSPDELEDVADLQVQIEVSPETEEEEELIDSGAEVEGNIHISSEDEDVDFEAIEYNNLIDLQISGNGWGGVGRLEDDQDNQRFLIQIFPKIGDIK